MYFITFSRKMGTNGSEIARRVAEQMGYNFYDTEAIEGAAQEMGFLKDVKEIDEKAPSLYQRFFSQKSEVYLDRLHSVIYELASRGNAVFLGRGSHMLLRSFKCALHVRVTASLENRIENLVGRGWPREVAIKEIDTSDHERGSFIKFAFRVDWNNPESLRSCAQHGQFNNRFSGGYGFAHRRFRRNKGSLGGCDEIVGVDGPCQESRGGPHRGRVNTWSIHLRFGARENSINRVCSRGNDQNKSRRDLKKSQRR